MCVYTLYTFCLIQVHRRILVDDNRGVGEPLNETGQNGDGLIIRGKHLILLDDFKNSTYFQRILAEKLMLEPELAFVKNSDNSDNNYNVQVWLTLTKQYNVPLSLCAHIINVHIIKEISIKTVDINFLVIIMKKINNKQGLL